MGLYGNLSFSASGTLSPPSNCDHSVIFASMNLFTHRSRSCKRHVWNFNNVNITDLNEELSQLDWFSLCESSNEIDEIYSCWYNYFRSIIKKYIPLKTVTIRPNLGWIVKCERSHFWTEKLVKFSWKILLKVYRFKSIVSGSLIVTKGRQNLETLGIC